MRTYTTMSYHDIAGRFNAMQQLPAAAGGAFGALVADLAAKRSVLDLGAGAGRLSLPSAQRGAAVVALDYELNMIRQAAADARAAAASVHPLQADGARLPFADRTFGVVIINNVLHLVVEWRVVLREVQRVLTTDGVLLMGRDVLDPTSAASHVRNTWRRILGKLHPSLRPTSASGRLLAEALIALGGEIEAERTIATWIECVTPLGLLDRMRRREHNETWSLDDAVLEAGLARLRTWVDQSLQPEAEESAEWRLAVTIVRGLGSRRAYGPASASTDVRREPREPESE